MLYAIDSDYCVCRMVTVLRRSGEMVFVAWRCLRLVTLFYGLKKDLHTSKTGGLSILYNGNYFSEAFDDSKI